MSSEIPSSVYLIELLTEIHRADFSGAASRENYFERRHAYAVDCIYHLLNLANNNLAHFTKMNDNVYIYGLGSWHRLSKEELMEFFESLTFRQKAEYYLSSYFDFKEALYKQLQSVVPIMHDRKKDEIKINFENGTLLVTAFTAILANHNPHYGFTYRLNYEYNSNALAPKFIKFINRILPDVGLQNLFFEYLGYCLIPNHGLKLEKFLLLTGLGANGKSVLFDIVTALFGKDNITNFSLRDLTDKTGYYRHEIQDKKINYASELTNTGELQLLKLMVSGEPLGARLPYGKPKIMTNYAKLIFNTNTLPPCLEYTDAYFRRFCIIPFEVQIPKAEQDPNLAKSIIDDELPGIFRMVCDGLQRVLSQQRLSEPVASIKALEEYKQGSNSVKQFFVDAGYMKSDSHFVSLKSILEEFRKYTLSTGDGFVSRNEFTRRLRLMNIVMVRKNNGYHLLLEKVQS